MQTLTYGRLKPENQDKGGVFWDALALNIVKDDAHTHDGVTSAPVQSYNLARGTVSVPATTGWVAMADGRWKYTVTMPAGYTWGACNPRTFISGGTYDQHQVFASLVPVTTTTFEVHMLTNDTALSIIFT